MQESLDNLAYVPVFELDALLDDFLLNLVLITGATSDSSDEPGPQLVQWVHSSDLVDPSPFLAPRTVLLTTGSQFGAEPDRDALDSYVRSLVAAGITALGIGVGLQWERIPPALISACELHRLPLIRVPYDTPFLAVVRTAAQLQGTTRAAEWGRETTALPSRLTRTERLVAGEAALRLATLTLLRNDQRDLAEQIAAAAMPALPRGAVVVMSFADPLPSACQRELTPLTTATDGVLSAATSTGTLVVAEVQRSAAIRQLLTQHRIAAGLSERGTLQDLSELIEQAERAAHLAHQSDTDAPLSYRPDMHAGVLQLLHESPEATRRAQGLLAPLRRHDERHGDVLTDSIATWLRYNGQMSVAAQQLSVHRHTLRSRLHTAATLLQLDIDDPSTRAELWAALSITTPGGAR